MIGVLEQGEKYPAYFWRPDDPEREHLIAGLIWLDDRGGPVIQLHAPLTDLSWFPTEKDHPDLVYGKTIGTAVTLRRLTVISSQQGMRLDEPGAIVYRAQWAYLGGRWLDEADEEFDQVRVSFWDQDAWVDKELVRLVNPTLDSGVAIRSLRMEPVQLPCGDVDLRVEDATGWHGTTIDPGTRFALEFPSPKSFFDLVGSWLPALQFLVVSATARPAGIRSLHVSRSEWANERRERTVHSNWLRVYLRTDPKPELEHSSLKLLHRLEDFNGGVTSAPIDLARWFSSYARHEFAVEQFAAIRAGQTGGPATTMLSAAQAVESLDRRIHPDEPTGNEDTWGVSAKQAMSAAGIPPKIRRKACGAIKNSYRPSLEERLRRLDAETGNFVRELVGNRRWATDVQDLRNIVAHGLEDTDRFQNDTRGLRVAKDILILLFELRWLVLIGFTPEQARELAKRRVDFWHTQNELQDGLQHVRTLVASERA